MNEWTLYFAEQPVDNLNRQNIPAALVHAMELADQKAGGGGKGAYTIDQEYRKSLEVGNANQLQ